MASLLVLLARQTSLMSLKMKENLLSAAQQRQIRDVVTQTATSFEIERLEF